MKEKKWLIGLLTIAAFETTLASTKENCLQDLSPGLRKTYYCQGQAFNLTVSPECAQGSCGLILDVHGRNMDPFLQDQNTGLSAYGPKYGYIVLQPFAPNQYWETYHYPAVYTFYRMVKKAFKVDDKRIHMTGFSQGSIMTLWFMCVFRKEFASYAPSSAAGGSICADVKGGIPDVPILYQHGWYDNLAPWYLAEAFSNQVRSQYKYDLTMDIGDQYSHRSEWTNQSGNRFILLSHGYTTASWYGAGHCFPGAPYRNIHSCSGVHSYSWAAEVLRFFINTPRRN